MIATNLKNRFNALIAAFGVGIMAVSAVPAQANSSAAAADITAPVRDGNISPLGGGDDQFRALFGQWEALDDGNSNPVPAVSVAIPSRMPLSDSKLTSGFGMRNHPVTGGRRAHKGIDLSAPTGTPIYATADGRISKADWFSSYGLYVSIEHGASLQTRYAHMSKLAVANGQMVKKGDIIGYVGSTGRSTGPHLHYEVRMDGKAVNPIPYMAESDAQQAFALKMGDGGKGGAE